MRILYRLLEVLTANIHSVLNSVLQYLNGTTKNPLVVDKNATLISDFRIFNSDGNVTMNKSDILFQS